AVRVLVVVVLELLGAMLHADDERGRPAAQLAELARHEAADGEELARRVDLVEAEQIVEELGRIRRAGPGQRAAARIEVKARRDAGRAGRGVAARAAETADCGAEAVDEHVRSGDEEVVLAELHAELPAPRVAGVSGQRPRDAARRALVAALDRLAARADQPADELHVGAVRIVRMRDLDDRKARERERRRGVAERLVVRDVELDAPLHPIAHLVRKLEIADVALLLRHEAPERAEIELAEAERDRADRG